MKKTVAVSEDIKTYLMDNYHIPSGDINVTINGIDTEKFSPKTDCEDIKKELGIKDDDTVITYVSRLDESKPCCKTAYRSSSRNRQGG